MPEFLPVWIALGAIPGTLSRYYLTLFFAEKLREGFPWGTFFINLSGSFGIGFLAVELQKISTEPWLNGFFIVGFLGSYTTFSTFILDFSNLLTLENRRRAWLYGLGSPLAGFWAVELGIALAQHL